MMTIYRQTAKFILKGDEIVSDTIFRIIPRYSHQVYTDEQITRAVNTLKLTSTEEITFANYRNIQFIDCGEGLKHIFCQWCGHELNQEYWQEKMSKAYNGKSYEYLGLKTHCCNLSSSLDEFIYIKPCGFASFVIEVHNPTTIPCAIDLHEMGKCFGHTRFFKMISAHI